MRFNLFLFINLVWYSCLLYLGFCYLEWNQASYENSPIDWEYYAGVYLSTPEKRYFGLWVLSTAVSMFFLVRTSVEQSRRGVHLGLINFFLLFSYILLYAASEDFNLQETKIWWVISTLIQLIGHSILLVEQPLLKPINTYSSLLFLGYAAVFFCLLGLGFYYWQWDTALVAERLQEGEAHYYYTMVPEGGATKTPELHYHLMLAIASLFYLSLIHLLQWSNNLLTTLKVACFFVLLYSVFVYVNGYAYTMGGTVGWWVGSCSFIGLLSGILFWKNRKTVGRGKALYRDNLLDDFSTLEQ